MHSLPTDLLGLILNQVPNVWRYAGVCKEWSQEINHLKPMVHVRRDCYFENLGILLRLCEKRKVNLDLDYTAVKDVSMLGKVHTLSVWQTDVTDVSALGNVHNLYLDYTQVKDVSALGNVHTLSLYYTQVTDVSALGNVHDLDLGKTKIKDVSGLNGVHSLDLRKTDVTDVTMLTQVKHIVLFDGSWKI